MQISGPHYDKHKMRENYNHQKKHPQGAPLEPKNANFLTIEFRAEPPMYFIYILVVYEEYIIKSSKFNIRKITMVRVPLWFLEVIFCIPQKVPLR